MLGHRVVSHSCFTRFLLFTISISVLSVLVASPAQSQPAWRALGAGVKGDFINRLHVWDGKLVVGGGFLSVDGLPAHNIAAWDGIVWSTLGTGWDELGGITEYNGQLVVAGRRLSRPNAEVAAWDGSSWSTISQEGYCQLTGFNGKLYGCGPFNFGPGGIHTGARLYEYDGTTWNTVLSLSSTEYTLNFGDIKVLDGELHVSVSPDGGVGSYDGTTWTNYNKSGLFALSLAKWNGQLFSAGADEGLDTMVRQWDGTSWNLINPGFHDTCGLVIVMTEFDGLLYAAGLFDEGFCSVPSASVLSWDGANWEGLGQSMNDAVCGTLMVRCGRRAVCRLPCVSDRGSLLGAADRLHA